MIHARLDRKTRMRVLCGGVNCRGEFGSLYYSDDLMLSNPSGLRPADGFMVQPAWPGQVVEKCPRCAEENLIDLSVLMDIQRLIAPPPTL